MSRTRAPQAISHACPACRFIQRTPYMVLCGCSLPDVVPSPGPHRTSPRPVSHGLNIKRALANNRCGRGPADRPRSAGSPARAPNEPDKDKWIGRERLRWARAFNVPMPEDMPPSFPPMTLAMMRALCVIAKDDESDAENEEEKGDATAGGSVTTLVQALDALFAEYWVNHTPTYESAELERVLRRLLGDEGAESGACI